MNPQDITAIVGLAVVMGGCFTLAFIDPWLEERRFRKRFRPAAGERRVTPNYTDSHRSLGG